MIQITKEVATWKTIKACGPNNNLCSFFCAHYTHTANVKICDLFGIALMSSDTGYGNDAIRCNACYREFDGELRHEMTETDTVGYSARHCNDCNEMIGTGETVYLVGNYSAKKHICHKCFVKLEENEK